MLASEYLQAIKASEGFTPRASWDYQQHSNGYGTRARFPGEVIDRPEAERRFSDEIGAAARQVDAAFPNLPPGARAALSSLTFNAGPGWMNAGLGDAVRRGDWNDAQSRFLQYNKAGGSTLPGLADRRKSEAAWFTGGAPTGNTTMSPMEAAMQAQQPALVQALAGEAPQRANPFEALSSGLQRAGLWAMSLDNPGALGQLAQFQRSPSADYQLVQGADGAMFRLNKRTGAVTPFAEGERKVDSSALKSVGEGYQSATLLNDTGKEAQRLKGLITSGGLDVGLASRGKAAVESLFGSSSPQTQNYNDFQRFRTEAANAILQAAKGTQTEGDAKRAYDQFVSALASNDNASVQKALDRLTQISDTLVGTHRTTFEAYDKANKNHSAFSPYREGYGKIKPNYRDSTEPTGAGQRPPLSSFYK